MKAYDEDLRSANSRRMKIPAAKLNLLEVERLETD